MHVTVSDNTDPTCTSFPRPHPGRSRRPTIRRPERHLMGVYRRVLVDDVSQCCLCLAVSVGCILGLLDADPYPIVEAFPRG